MPLTIARTLIALTVVTTTLLTVAGVADAEEFAQPPPAGVAIEPVAPPAPVVTVARPPRRPLFEDLARQPFRMGLNLGLAIQGAPNRPLAGLDFGLYAVAYDRLQLGLKVAGFGDTRPDKNAGGTFASSTDRAQVGIEAGYRLRLARSFAAYLIPSVGLLGTADITDTQLGVRKNGLLFTNDQKSTRWSATPTVGASLQLGGFDVGYRYQFDLKDSRFNTHAATIGIRF